MAEPQAKPPSAGLIWAAAFLLLLLYVLSVGPVLFMCKNYPTTTPALRNFYYPLILLHEKTLLRNRWRRILICGAFTDFRQVRFAPSNRYAVTPIRLSGVPPKQNHLVEGSHREA